MLSIQDAGKQVLTGNPGKFYVFAGDEYGVKSKYLDALKQHYKECVEADTVESIFSLMSIKHLIPLPPKLYIVRYDEEFIASITAATTDKIKSMKIIGTLVCVYESTKSFNKCEKYLPDYTVSFDTVSPEFIKKYLVADYPNLPQPVIDFAVSVRPDYKSASTICNCMSHADLTKVNFADLSSLAATFGCNSTTNEAQLKIGVASRNFAYCLTVLDTYGDDINSAFYTILSTLIELEKLLESNYGQSELRQYIKGWNITDIYYMFMNTYDALKKSRSYTSHDIYDSLVYLLGLLQFSPVPSPEVMNNGIE